MAFAPPSYQAAAYRRLWIIVAPYVHSYDLYRACLVCRQWHQLFAPFLWGDPAKKFGFDDDNIYLNLTRFKRLLTRTRLEVRRLAHTLHIPPAQPEFYDGPQAGWLRDILDRLPSLQALIVSNLSFFDHSSLLEIQHRSQSHTTYPLKLLIASDLENTTAASLTTALTYFPELVYLNLSAAQGVRSPYVLRQIGNLTELRVLKLKSCGLRDDDIDNLKFSKRFRSLDVSYNLLTEKGLAKLSEKLFFTSSASVTGIRYSGVPLPTKVLAEGLDTFIVRKLTSGVDGYLSVEEGMPAAFSHLDVASNYLTVESLSRYLGRHGLQHLNCGSLNLSPKPYDNRSSGASSRRFSGAPEIELLTLETVTHAFRNLTSLRIHHSIITSQPFSGIQGLMGGEYFGLQSEDLSYVLNSAERTRRGASQLDGASIGLSPEPAEPAEPRNHAALDHPHSLTAQVQAGQPVEVEADDSKHIASPIMLKREVQVTATPAHNKHPSPTEVQTTTDGHPMPRDSRLDNESADHVDFSKLKMPDEMKALGTCWAMRNTTKGLPSPPPRAPAHPPPFSDPPPPFSVSPKPYNVPRKPIPSPSTSYARGGPERLRSTSYTSPSTFSEILVHHPQHRSPGALFEEAAQRQHRIATLERHPGRFKPSLLPHLKSLTLTDVPSITHRRTIPNTIALFIQELAEEEELARLQELSRYAPMSQAHPSRSPTATLRMRCLALEITSQPDRVAPPRTSTARAKRSSATSYTKSSTEDPDSESFMNRISSDFSFFREDDGGLLVSEGRIDRPGSASLGIGRGVGEGDGRGEGEGEGKEVDVVMELSRVRRSRKADFEMWMREGRWGVEQVLGGYWRGEVRVLREGR